MSILELGPEILASKWLCKLEMMLLTNEGNCYVSMMIHICSVQHDAYTYIIGGDIPTRPARRQYLPGTAPSILKVKLHCRSPFY